MYRPTHLEVTLRRQEQLREAADNRRATAARQPAHRTARFAQVLGLRPTPLAV